MTCKHSVYLHIKPINVFPKIECYIMKPLLGSSIGNIIPNSQILNNALMDQNEDRICHIYTSQTV